ncbi:hypothetical protein MJO29_016736 [Puccinia striiformis f. sp. tritici]|nr:hypothetical protein MJO29_016736 [Puccinia striiformis f. sp. tritici]
MTSKSVKRLLMLAGLHPSDRKNATALKLDPLMPDATGYEEPCQGQGNTYLQHIQNHNWETHSKPLLPNHPSSPGNSQSLPTCQPLIPLSHLLTSHVLLSNANKSFEESPPPSLHSEQQWDSDKLKEEHQSDDKSHECASSREEQDNEGPEEFTSHSLGPDLQQYTELQAQLTALEAQRNGEIREGIINHNDDGIVDIDTYQADQERQASSMDEDPLTSLRQSSVTVQGEPTSLPVDLPSQPYPPPPMNYLPCYFLSYSLDNLQLVSPSYN